MGRLFISLGILSSLATSAAVAKEPAALPPDKSRYHLFNPVPAPLMREMTTDRPDKTESPFTIDAGHLQIESDLANFSYDRYNPDRVDTRVESWSFATANFRFGLLNNLELNVIIEPWSSARVDERPGRVTRMDGFGDVTLRAKVNLWGNDGGRTAFALLPYVKLPTNEDDLGNDAVEGGLILPLAVDLGGGWAFGAMTAVDIVQDSDGSGHHAEWVNSITFCRELTEDLSAYVEFFSLVSAEPHTPWVGTVDLGLTYAFTENVQLDAGVNIGLTRAADDVNPFLGLSVRF